MLTNFEFRLELDIVKTSLSFDNAFITPNAQPGIDTVESHAMQLKTFRISGAESCGHPIATH